MWEYEYDSETDKTTIYWDDDKIGTVDEEITSWRSGLPKGEAREIIKNAVDDPMVVDLLYDFSEIQE